ncbi:MAG: hypothetical protein KatS3mg077_0519 [Candidatus Binatia bacterium]|nr:MAG: hypothetical protein KatS3mg077_0519 [Candidatus Binatia bacterium]
MATRERVKEKNALTAWGRTVVWVAFVSTAFASRCSPSDGWRQAATKWLEACNRRDAKAWKAVFGADGTYEDPLTKHAVPGAVHEGPFARLWHEAKSWRCEMAGFVRLEDSALLEWRANGQVGEVELEFRGLAVFAVQDDRLVWMRNYFDTRPFLKLLQAERAGRRP